MSPGGTGFRCARAAEDAGDDPAGSASTVRAFLLVEVEGAWGADALRARLVPPAVSAHLAELEKQHRVRPLVIRRQGSRAQSSGGINVFVACTAPDDPWLEHAVLDDFEGLLDLDLSGVAAGRRPGLDRHDEPLFCVCTHGRHDACCAERGRPVWEALNRAAPEDSWQVSHIGGDRFAANVLVLPEGLYYGRVQATDAARLVTAHRRGTLLLDHLRGRSAYPFAVQAAEAFLRRALGVAELDRVRVVRQRRDGSETEATFVCDGTTRRVRVRAAPGPTRQLTCRARASGRPITHQLVSLE